ncbi:hypothetical protein V8D89_007155 [Ganoderma adspersum]
MEITHPEPSFLDLLRDREESPLPLYPRWKPRAQKVAQAKWIDPTAGQVHCSGLGEGFMVTQARTEDLKGSTVTCRPGHGLRILPQLAQYELDVCDIWKDCTIQLKSKNPSTPNGALGLEPANPIRTIASPDSVFDTIKTPIQPSWRWESERERTSLLLERAGRKRSSGDPQPQPTLQRGDQRRERSPLRRPRPVLSCPGREEFHSKNTSQCSTLCHDSEEKIPQHAAGYECHLMPIDLDIVGLRKGLWRDLAMGDPFVGGRELEASRLHLAFEPGTFQKTQRRTSQLSPGRRAGESDREGGALRSAPARPHAVHNVEKRRESKGTPTRVDRTPAISNGMVTWAQHGGGFARGLLGLATLGPPWDRKMRGANPPPAASLAPWLVVHQAARISSTVSRMLLLGSCYRALACSCRRFGTARRLRTDGPTAFAIVVVLPDVNRQNTTGRCNVNVTMRKYQPETTKHTVPKNAVQDASPSVWMHTAIRSQIDLDFPDKRSKPSKPLPTTLSQSFKSGSSPDHAFEGDHRTHLKTARRHRRPSSLLHEAGGGDKASITREVAQTSEEPEAHSGRAGNMHGCEMRSAGDAVELELVASRLAMLPGSGASPPSRGMHCIAGEKKMGCALKLFKTGAADASRHAAARATSARDVGRGVAAPPHYGTCNRIEREQSSMHAALGKGTELTWLTRPSRAQQLHGAVSTIVCHKMLAVCHAGRERERESPRIGPRRMIARELRIQQVRTFARRARGRTVHFASTVNRANSPTKPSIAPSQSRDLGVEVFSRPDSEIKMLSRCPVGRRESLGADTVGREGQTGVCSGRVDIDYPAEKIWIVSNITQIPSPSGARTRPVPPVHTGARTHHRSYRTVLATPSAAPLRTSACPDLSLRRVVHLTPRNGALDLRGGTQEGAPASDAVLVAASPTEGIPRRPHPATWQQSTRGIDSHLPRALPNRASSGGGGGRRDECALWTSEMEALVVRGEAKPWNGRHNACYGTPEGHHYRWRLQGRGREVTIRMSSCDRSSGSWVVKGSRRCLPTCICEHRFTTEVNVGRSGNLVRTETRFLGLLRRNGLTVAHICKVDTTHAIADTVEKDMWKLVPHAPRFEP